MEREEGELSGKSKLVFEACLKIQQGQKLISEGRLELASILGETKVKKLTPGQKSAITKKLLVEKETKFHKDNRSDEQVKVAMLKMVQKAGQASTVLFQRKLKLSERRLHRLLGEMSGSGLLVNEGGGADGAHHKWVQPKKPINGHKLAKTPGSGGNKGHKTNTRRSQIDVTDQTVVAKAKEFLATNDWVNKGKFLDAVDLSPGPGNRLIEYMKKQKIVKEVSKRNNPAHDKEGVRKLYPRFFSYLELA